MSAQQPEQPDRTPQPNQILATPDTVESCQAEYADGADVRSRLGWTDGQN